ncbi:MAG: MBL fold metallo-hydrolase [Oscillospiraceae bacterium]|nr:MBL fold metallo-hydrolase [Oscillospiraceae bacterium]
MDWHKVTERMEYVSVDGSLIGVYHLGGGSRVVLLDVGAMECPEFLEDIKARGLTVVAMLCSHLHFDHISSAGIIFDEFGCPGYASELEALEEEFPTRYFDIIPISGTEPLIIEGERFEVIPTPGHTKGHLAFVTPEGICCVGDAFMSESVLRYAKVPYFDDVDKAIESMEVIRESQCKGYLLCHEAMVWPEELDGLIDANIDKELELYRMIREFVTEPIEMEELVTAFMKHCGIRSKAILSSRGYRATVRVRIKSLLFNGELRLEGGMVMPVV